MDRIRRGFRLAGASWRVVRSDKQLLVLPVLSFLCTAIVGALLFAVAFADGLPRSRSQFTGMDYALLAVFYFVSSFITIFFNAAVVGTAMRRLKGEPATIRDGLRLASSKLGKIAGWAALTATVGLLLRSLEERAGFLGRILIWIVGAAWAAITFFVVPVLLFEPLGVGESVKRSASIFKQRWGEQFTGNATIGLAVVLVAIPVAILVVLLAAAAPPVGIVVGILAFGLLAAVGAALSGVFNTALYRYATTGEASGAFSEADLQGSFRPKRSGGLIGS
jgi:hypothetical protein